MHDHRKLGRELGLYHHDPLVGAGLPLWLPAGAAARHAVEEYLREVERRAGYQHVYSPPLAHRELYERSGHLPHFAPDMFPAFGDDDLVLRPSLCPHHAVVYAARGRSYRDLPLRVAELGPMFRAERSGVLGGLARVRAISLNDAHIFCAPDQAAGEVAGVLRLMRRVHAALGVRIARFRLSLRDPGGGKYVDDPAMWQRAEAVLREALASAGLDVEEAPGEAAFYGPKIDAQYVDGSGREWSLATVQVDLHQPARFGLSYVDAKQQKQQPVMVHRSLVGSLERLFAHLIEVHGGAFPVWYAPVQVVALPVGESQHDAAAAFVARASDAGLRAELAVDGSLGARIRAAVKDQRVPYVAVVGEREAARGDVSLRRRDGHAFDPMPAADAVRHLAAEVSRSKADGP